MYWLKKICIDCLCVRYYDNVGCGCKVQSDKRQNIMTGNISESLILQVTFIIYLAISKLSSSNLVKVIICKKKNQNQWQN